MDIYRIRIKSSIFRFRFIIFSLQQQFKQGVLCALNNTATAVVLFVTYDLLLPHGPTE